MSKPKLTPVETTITEPIVGVDLTKLTPEEQAQTMMDPSCQDYPAKNYKIIFKEQEEHKIFKEFEELGYRIENNDGDFVEWVHIEKNKIIIIFKYKKQYECRDSVWGTRSATMQEHQLLHRLFEIWGWFDE